MDKELLKAMIRNCFYQYRYTEETIPLSEADYEELMEKVLMLQQEEPRAGLREIIDDVVYEFLT